MKQKISQKQLERFKIEKEKQDYNRRNRINHILAIRPKLRKTAEQEELHQMLLDFPCFQTVAQYNFNNLAKLAEEIFMECLLPDSIIFKQNDQPEYCYVIMQGQAKVFVTFQIKKFNKTLQQTQQMCILENRDMFGELSLLFNQPRTATVQTLESCYAILIPKEAFYLYMNDPLLKKLSGAIIFLKSLSIFNDLKSDTFHILASKTTNLIVQANTLLVRQDKKSKYIYFIKRGKVTIVKNIPFLKIIEKITEQNYVSLFKDPEKYQINDENLVKFIQLEIAELSVFDCFGEDHNNLSNSLQVQSELIKQPIQYSAISKTLIECYQLKKKDFYSYICDKTRSNFYMYMKKYPKDRDIRSYFYQNISWNQQKKQYLNQIIQIPKIISINKKWMQEIELDLIKIEKKNHKIILPKIDKRAQNIQRIIDNSKDQKYNLIIQKKMEKEIQSKFLTNIVQQKVSESTLAKNNETEQKSSIKKINQNNQNVKLNQSKSTPLLNQHSQDKKKQYIELLQKKVLEEINEEIHVTEKLTPIQEFTLWASQLKQK